MADTLDSKSRIPLARSRLGAIGKDTVRAWRNGRRGGLRPNLSAPREIWGAELLKFGETFQMAIPSQAPERGKV